MFKARIRDGESDNGQIDSKFFALKMIKMDIDKEGFPITAMREIKLLKQLDHKNIVNLVEIVTSSGSQKNTFSASEIGNSRGQVYLVFDYAEHDLQGVLEKGVPLEKSHLKCLIK